MIKKNLDLKVRIPEWTQPGDVSCRVNGDRQHVEFLGRYVVLDGVRTGDTIEIMFPIQERIVKTKLVSFNNFPKTLFLTLSVLFI